MYKATPARKVTRHKGSLSKSLLFQHENGKNEGGKEGSGQFAPQLSRRQALMPRVSLPQAGSPATASAGRNESSPQEVLTRAATRWPGESAQPGSAIHPNRGGRSRAAPHRAGRASGTCGAPRLPAGPHARQGEAGPPRNVLPGQGNEERPHRF